MRMRVCCAACLPPPSTTTTTTADWVSVAHGINDKGEGYTAAQNTHMNTHTRTHTLNGKRLRVRMSDVLRLMRKGFLCRVAVITFSWRYKGQSSISLALYVINVERGSERGRERERLSESDKWVGLGTVCGCECVHKNNHLCSINRCDVFFFLNCLGLREKRHTCMGVLRLTIV